MKNFNSKDILPHFKTKDFARSQYELKHINA